MNTQEAAYIQRVRSNAHKLAEEIAMAIELASIYADRGYGSGGANELTDEELSASAGMTATLLASYASMAAQLKNFTDNLDVLTADWGATLNQVRSL